MSRQLTFILSCSELEENIKTYLRDISSGLSKQEEANTVYNMVLIIVDRPSCC